MSNEKKRNLNTFIKLRRKVSKQGSVEVLDITSFKSLQVRSVRLRVET